MLGPHWTVVHGCMMAGGLFPASSFGKERKSLLDKPFRHGKLREPQGIPNSPHLLFFYCGRQVSRKTDSAVRASFPPRFLMPSFSNCFATISEIFVLVLGRGLPFSLSTMPVQISRARGIHPCDDGMPLEAAVPGAARSLSGTGTPISCSHCLASSSFTTSLLSGRLSAWPMSVSLVLHQVCMTGNSLRGASVGNIRTTNLPLRMYCLA